MEHLEHNGYYPLKEEFLERLVPTHPGIYMLAVQLPNGVYQNFFTSQTDHLYHSLKSIASKEASKVPEIVLEYMQHYQCYFTYFAILKTDFRDEVVKMLTQTADPVIKLNLINCN